MNKRSMSPSTESRVIISKRQKILDTPIQRNELVSALALASLALHSPKHTLGHTVVNTKETDEDRSPGNASSQRCILPITPSPSVSKKCVPYDMSPPPPRHQSIRPMAVPNRYRRQQGPQSPYILYPDMRQSIRWMPPPVASPIPLKDDQWICDFCNSASFTSFQAACNHEEICSQKRFFQDETRDEAPDAPQWRSGSISLAIPSTDSEWLSTTNCYIRQHCVEAFSATEDDVLRTSKRGRIVQNQVGIRCTFCTKRPWMERAPAAVSYPTSVDGIYESVKRWQRVHLLHCHDAPLHHKEALGDLQSGTVWIPTTRQYWSDSAKAIGMVDTAEGIRFSKQPRDSTNWTPEESNKEHVCPVIPPPSSDSPASSSDAMSNDICLPTDRKMIPPYVFFVLRQVERCQFSESDRFVARSKGPVGFAGFQCKHCIGHAGLGKYFPLSAKSLGTNSTSQNIHAHILKCRKVPVTVKQELLALKEEKGRSPRLIPGWRKTFFELVWKRLHGDK
jgi:hypothetical protein